MRKTTLVLLTLLVLAPFLISSDRAQTVSVGAPNPFPQLSIIKLHTNATAIGPCTINIGQVNGGTIQQSATLFGGIRVVLNMTLSQTNATMDIRLSAFSLTVTQNNLIITNSTSGAQHELPTNIISDLVLNPGIPVILVLSFAPVCYNTSLSIAKLNYFDNINSFQFNLP